MALAFSIVLWTAVVLGALVGVLLVAVLALPFECETAGVVDEETLAGHVHARFGWGLLAVRAESGRGVTVRVVGRRLALGGNERRDTREEARQRAARAAAKKATAKEKAAKKKAAKKRRARRRRSLRDVLRARSALRRALGRAMGALHLDGRVEGTIGLDDPADTAVVIGLVSALAAGTSRLSVDVGPSWMEETVRLRAQLRARFRLAALAWIALRALATSEVRRALLGQRRA